MQKFLHSSRVVALCAFLLSSLLIPIAAHADEIVILVDDQGRKVFINTGDSTGHAPGILKGYRAATASAAPTPVASEEIEKLVKQAASRNQVDPDLVKAVIQVESGFDPKAVSSKGAMGLMQLIPATAHRFGVSDPFDPKQNIEGGVNYLKYLLDMFGGDLNLSLAAYNAGEHAVQKFGGVPSIPETQSYVRKVTSIYQTGDAPAAGRPGSKQAQQPAITRSVDENGVVHFSNVD
jgi:hypothetical protein